MFKDVKGSKHLIKIEELQVSNSYLHLTKVIIKRLKCKTEVTWM